MVHKVPPWDDGTRSGMPRPLKRRARTRQAPPPVPPENLDMPKRLRAARAYAGLTQPELADRLGVGRMTIVRGEEGEREPKRMELREIAEICGVPLAFLEHGFAALEVDPRLRELLAKAKGALQGREATLLEIDALAAELDALARGTSDPPSGKKKRGGE